MRTRQDIRAVVRGRKLFVAARLFRAIVADPPAFISPEDVQLLAEMMNQFETVGARKLRAARINE